MQERRHASILGGSLAVGSSTAFRLATNFVIAILVARLLGAEAKGQLALLQQFPAITALVLGLGFESAHAYYVGRHKRNPSATLSDSIAFAAAASAVGLPIVALVMREFVPALAGVPTGTLVVAAAAVPSLLLASMVGGILTGQGRVAGQAYAQAGGAAVTLALIGTLAAFGALTLERVVIATLLGMVVGIGVSLSATGVRTLPAPSISRLREEMTYAKRSYVQSVTGYLELRQDVLLLGVLASAAGVGVYSVGASLAELLFYAPQTVAVALAARSYQEEAASGAALTAATTRLLTAFMLVAVVALALIVRPLVITVFGAEFAEAAPVFLILAPGIIIWGMASQASVYLATHGRLFPRVSTATLLVNLALNLILIPLYGVRGAAVATTISYSLSSTYIMYTFVRITSTRATDLLVLRAEDIRFAAAAARALIRRP